MVAARNSISADAGSERAAPCGLSCSARQNRVGPKVGLQGPQDALRSNGYGCGPAGRRACEGQMADGSSNHRKHSIMSEMSAPLSFRKDSVRQQQQQRLERFREIHGSEAESIIALTQRYDWEIKRASRWNRFVLHPGRPGRAGSFLQLWDLVTMLALLYTIFLSPFEAGFLEASIGTAAWRDPWFIANRCLDAVFLCDMLLQFFIAYESVDEMGGAMWVEDRPLMIADNR